MPEKCPPSYNRCGTCAPTWLNGRHPTIGDGVVSRQACGYYSKGRCQWSFTVKVKMCPSGFYVYYLPDVPHCYLAYCVEYHDICLHDNGECSHYCSMDKSTFNAVCSCPKGFGLGKDHRTCVPEVTVTCTDQHLQLDLLRSAFHGLNESQLQLVDPSCQGTGNRTFITFKSPLHGCGTSMNFTNSSVVYSNVVSTRPNYLSLMSGVVTWAGTVEVPFECEYARDHWIGHSFKPVVEKMSFKEKGRGNLTFNIQQFQSDKFATAYSKKDYPVSIKIRDHMYFVLSVNTKSKDVKLFADTCKATPSSSPFDLLQFFFIINGCPVSQAVKFLPSQDPREIRMSIQAFQFLNSFPQIYLHCKLVVCHTADMTSRCTKGCVQDDGPGKRRAESVDDFQLSEGPFHYIVY